MFEIITATYSSEAVIESVYRIPLKTLVTDDFTYTKFKFV